MTDSLARLHTAVLAARSADPASSKTARLLRSGRSKMAKKLAEEAVEVVIDAMNGQNDAVVRESADLLYHLVVLWVSAGIDPNDVWAEMARREQLFGIAEKLPKDLPKTLPKGVPKELAKDIAKDLSKVLPDASRRKVVTLESRRVPKRH